MDPVLWVQPDEVWPDREEPGKINYILRGDGFERWMYVRDREGYANHNPKLHQFLAGLAEQNTPR